MHFNRVLYDRYAYINTNLIADNWPITQRFVPPGYIFNDPWNQRKPFELKMRMYILHILTWVNLLHLASVTSLKKVFFSIYIGIAALYWYCNCIDCTVQTVICLWKHFKYLKTNFERKNTFNHSIDSRCLVNSTVSCMQVQYKS